MSPTCYQSKPVLGAQLAQMNHANELQRITDECEKHGSVASMILGDAPRTRILRQKHRIILRTKWNDVLHI